MNLMDDLEFYPGSKEKRAPRPVEEPERPDLGKGRFLLVNGREIEFFGIGELALVLNRRPVTIRMWENEGILPTSGWTKPGKDKAPQGRRRLWTRAQVEGIWRIAREENVLIPGPRVNIKKTQFTSRVEALFQSLREF